MDVLLPRPLCCLSFLLPRFILHLLLSLSFLLYFFLSLILSICLSIYRYLRNFQVLFICLSINTFLFPQISSYLSFLFLFILLYLYISPAVCICDYVQLFVCLFIHLSFSLSLFSYRVYTRIFFSPTLFIHSVPLAHCKGTHTRRGWMKVFVFVFRTVGKNAEEFPAMFVFTDKVLNTLAKISESWEMRWRGWAGIHVL